MTLELRFESIREESLRMKLMSGSVTFRYFSLNIRCKACFFVNYFKSKIFAFPSIILIFLWKYWSTRVSCRIKFCSLEVVSIMSCSSWCWFALTFINILINFTHFCWIWMTHILIYLNCQVVAIKVSFAI